MMYCEKCENPVTYDDKTRRKCPHCGAKLRTAMIALLVLFICVGCGGQAGFTNISDTPRKGVTDKPSAEIKEQASGLTAFAKAVEVKQDTAITLIQSNAAALARIESKLEASLVKSDTQPSGGDPAVLESPAKANTQQAPLKVATPGTSQSESLVELATRLYAQGVNTNMKTREELEAIDAQLNRGQPVTGAMFPNNRTSAITSQRNAVRFVPRGRSRFFGKTNTAGQTCGPNGCY
jgi:hypothetical protein